MSHSRKKYDEEFKKRMEHLIIAQPDITLQEIKDQMDLQISIPAISKIISGKLHYRYKKRRYMPVNATARCTGKAKAVERATTASRRIPSCISG